MELPLMLAMTRAQFFEKLVSGDKVAWACMAGGIGFVIIRRLVRGKG